MTTRFYYTKTDKGAPRHVVEVLDEGGEDGTVSVRLVGFHPTVEGTAKRGRKPALDRAKLADLTPLEDEHVSSFAGVAQAAGDATAS